MLSYHICTCNVKIKKCSCKDTTRLGAQFQIHICYMKSYTWEQAFNTRGWIHTLPWPLLLPKEYQDTWGGYRGTNIWSWKIKWPQSLWPKTKLWNKPWLSWLNKSNSPSLNKRYRISSFPHVVDTTHNVK